jgi:hypothetical protein
MQFINHTACIKYLHIEYGSEETCNFFCSNFELFFSLFIQVFSVSP